MRVQGIMRKNTYLLHRLAAIGVLTGMSLIVFIVESFFPPLFVPGAKLGLSNLFSLIALILWSPVEAFAILICRTLLGSILVGNLSSLVYSLCAGTAALAVGSVLLYTVFPRIGFVCISVTSAVVHNIVQNAIFCAMSGVAQAWGYLPYLILLAIISGIATGACTVWIVRALPPHIYNKTMIPLVAPAQPQAHPTDQNAA